MGYLHHQKIRFKHYDPAGIVFYPRYFEMINDTVEGFFEAELDYAFGPMHPGNGVPTVQVSAEFSAPSRLGDMIDIATGVVPRGANKRFAATATLVHVGNDGRPTPWPDPVRARLALHLQGEDDAT